MNHLTIKIMNTKQLIQRFAFLFVVSIGVFFIYSFTKPADQKVINTPFSATMYHQTTLHSANQSTDFYGKCGGDKKAKKATKNKCGEGKCGDDKKAKEKKDSKCGEGKCGDDVKKAKAKKEGKCGEGKCGDDKKAAQKTSKEKDAKCGTGKCG